MKNKRLLAALAALCLLAAVMAAVWHSLKPTGQEGLKHFTVEVVHSDKRVNTFPCESTEEFLGAYLVAEGIISGSEGPYGLYVDTADGERAVYEESGAFWILSINGESAQVGADSTPIEDGALYTWTYTTG